MFVSQLSFQVPFFMDEENFNTPKADASFTPRENPRALFIRSFKKETAAPLKDETTPLQENGKLCLLRSFQSMLPLFLNIPRILTIVRLPT